MSYVQMDHAGWVQKNLEAAKRQKPTKRELNAAADQHKGWFAAPDQLNKFQRRSFDILGIVGGGIYNAPISWDALIWAPHYLVVPWRRSLATWDFQELTRFVFLCHEARIRGGIEANGHRHLKLALHERVATGDMSRRHPNLDEAVAAFRREVPADHSIMYREQAALAPVDLERA